MEIIKNILLARVFLLIEQKGKTFDQDFGNSFPLFSSLLKKGREKENEVAQIVIKRHAFLLDCFYCALFTSHNLGKTVLYAI